MYKKRKYLKFNTGIEEDDKAGGTDQNDPGGSEENIPFSQEQTQRYLSQRSILAATLRTQPKTVSQRTANTYFELLIQRGGVKESDGESFVLGCDVIVFVNKVRDILMRHPNYPENLFSFKSGLALAMSPNSPLVQKLLTGCTIVASDIMYQSQDSMLVNLLMIDFLTAPILEVLLEKIEDIAVEETLPHATGGMLPLLPLLLTQLQYLRHSHVDTIFPHIKNVLSKASLWAKWEIITHADFILDASKHDEFAQLIIDMLPDSDDFFRTTTIEALISLSLSMKLQVKLRCKILAYIKEGQCPYKMLPTLVKFLLKVINVEQDDVIMLINNLREIITEKLQIPKDNTTEHRCVQREVFECIAQSLKRSRKFYLIWQKIIINSTVQRYRCIDFIMLLIFAHIREENSIYITNAFRRAIKNDNINMQVLHEVRAKYCIVLEQYAITLMQILHDFVREKQETVSCFARSAYEVLFDICDNLQRDIITKLIDLTFDKKFQNLPTISLKMLRNLQRMYPKEIQNCGTLLLPLLDRLNEMSITQTRLIMDILCSIAYPPPNLCECPVLQEQIDMLIKKQLINRTTYVKKQGIIGSVQLINCIARTDATSMEIDDCNITYDTISDLPDGRGKIAANYVQRVQSSTLYSAESLALFYDELADACARTSHNSNSVFYENSFLAWICDAMTYNFQSNFICEETPTPIHGLSLSNQKCINTREDTASEEPDSEVLSVAINIGELALRANSQEASSSIIVLGPLFKLIRVLNSLRNEGSLEAINALLGCAIVLPSCFDDVEKIFLTYDDGMQRKLLDVHYHCVNWLRETVSSFATQGDAMIRNKVLQRLSELIHIEKIVRKLLDQAPLDYVPPMSQFINARGSVTAPHNAGARGKATTNKAQRNRAPKAAKGALLVNESEVSRHDDTNISHLETSRVAASTSRNGVIGGKKCGTSKKYDFDFGYSTQESYRQMDSDLMLILREQLCLTYPLPEEELGKKIGLLELRFVLGDLVCKLESLNGGATISEHPLQHVTEPAYFLGDLSKFLTTIVVNMQMLADAIGEHLAKADGVHGHADLFTDECNYMKSCFSLTLRLLAAFFSESNWTNIKKETLLKDSLLAMLERNNALDMREKSCGLVAAAAFKRFLSFEPFILELSSAAQFYKLLQTLNRFASVGISSTTFSKSDTNTVDTEAMSAARAKELRSLCRTLLCRKWYGYDNTALSKGTICNYDLDILVKGFLKDSDFRRQRETLNIITKEISYLNTGKDGAMRLFPNIRKANFPLLFRGLCEALISHLTREIGVNDNASDRLKIWEDSSMLLTMQLEILQRVEVPRIYQSFLKYSHLYLKLLIQYGLPVVETCLRQNPERIGNFLKSLQVTTRFLHNLCVHSKVTKQLSIISQIPFVRETIENLVFRIKAVLAANKCANVFWMGSLKNKDLHGEIVLSQTVSLNVSESEEDIPPEDDVSVDETIFDQNELLELEDTSSKDGNNRSKSSSRSKCI